MGEDEIVEEILMEKEDVRVKKKRVTIKVTKRRNELPLKN